MLIDTESLDEISSSALDYVDLYEPLRLDVPPIELQDLGVQGAFATPVINEIIGSPPEAMDESLTELQAAAILRDHVKALGDSVRGREDINRNDLNHISVLSRVVDATRELEASEGALGALKFYALCIENWGASGPDIEYALKTRHRPARYKSWTTQRLKTEQTLLALSEALPTLKLSGITSDHQRNTTDQCLNTPLAMDEGEGSRWLTVSFSPYMMLAGVPPLTAEQRDKIMNQIMSCAADVAYDNDLTPKVDVLIEGEYTYEGKFEIGYVMLPPDQ